MYPSPILISPDRRLIYIAIAITIGYYKDYSLSLCACLSAPAMKAHTILRARNIRKSPLSACTLHHALGLLHLVHCTLGALGLKCL